MANLVITPANVKAVTKTRTVTGQNAGASISAGQSVGLVSNVWQLAEASVANYDDYGIALNNAGLEQPLSVLTEGVIDLGTAVAQGQLFVISVTAGLIAEVGDIVAPNKYYIFGYGNDQPNQLVLSPYQVPFVRA